MMRTLLLRIAGLFRRRALDRRLDEELRFHLDMETEANRRRGMTAQEAGHAARREFGGVEQTKEIYRDRRGLPAIELVVRCLLYTSISTWCCFPIVRTAMARMPVT